jgi:hypothetical protein
MGKMTDEKNLEVSVFYEKHLVEIGAKKVKADYNAKPLGDDDINHLLSMIPEMREFIKTGRREKFFRWLGFIQGVLWKRGDFTLNELRNHNKP